MKILLFGGSGQLGYEITKRAIDLNFEIVSPVQSEVDITDGAQVRHLAVGVKPSIIINCAAYTAVDQAEQERDRCFAINRDGARNVAEAATKCGVRLIHLSTDYVFGRVELPLEECHPLTEEEPVAPVNVYGESKRAGEEAVLAACERALVVRTSSLYGLRGPNFVATMLRLFAEKGTVKVVDDQFMSPTWAGWLAEVLLDLCRIDCKGVLHACNDGVTTWRRFAAEILAISRAHIPHGERAEVIPIPSVQFPRPARRPSYSVLDCSHLARLIGRKPIPWREGLRYYLEECGMTGGGR
jgi:dTDP-4-dehydrorhamnose reductase